MHAFACPNCQRPIHFEARLCPHCGATLGFDPMTDAFRFLADEATLWRDAQGETRDVVVCANNDDHAICNWLVEPDEPSHLCRACRHNRTIPDLAEPSVPPRWARIEAAKRRMIHTLLKLLLPLETKAEEAPGRQGLAFDFLYDPAAEKEGRPQVMTGHDSGLITLNLIEADDAERERTRAAMGEPYRTLLGHFRHEVGHHYWSRLVENDPSALAEFREIFGDERADYQQALQNHYNGDSNVVWTEAYVSYYATSHPWEDFAETWAHYLHMVDLLATAGSLELSLQLPEAPDSEEIEVRFDPYTASAATLVRHMEPLAFALNCMNRSMGQSDAYPFRLSDAIVAKLAFIARLVAANRQATPPLSMSAEPLSA
ncbi:putative zinc-binding metallopeptidase [Novosphingobium profundi]|uniref:zinc-binding metallopeptidase family protein n=1 Tax=Novosphingobium profundi TaxID=1774954 RepID=UPI001BDA138A|nr:putative zinc-binding metallopeptidase [Novosphingobium profundi]MBT0667497.1 putative zinc-binding metallopeptidase [Novosphingobium profundi]